MMSALDIEQRVEDYFSSINSMANRIMVDREWAKKSVDVNLWSRMPDGDRNRFLMDSLIKSSPSLEGKYSYCVHSKPDVESFPKLDIRSGEKYIVVDDEGQGGTISRGGVKGEGGRRKSIGSSTWRDEHSGPFTWQTQSQLDLSFGSGDAAKKKTTVKDEEDVRVTETAPASSFEVYRTKKMEKSMIGKCFNKPRPPPPPFVANVDKQANNKVSVMKCAPPKPPPKGTAVAVMSELQSVVLNKSVDDDQKKKKKRNRASASGKEVVPSNENEVVIGSRAKPNSKSVVSEKAALCVSMNDLTLNVDQSPGEDSDIPKTGFDFLDNW